MSHFWFGTNSFLRSIFSANFALSRDPFIKIRKYDATKKILFDYGLLMDKLRHSSCVSWLNTLVVFLTTFVVQVNISQPARKGLPNSQYTQTGYPSVSFLISWIFYACILYSQVSAIIQSLPLFMNCLNGMFPPNGKTRFSIEWSKSSTYS